MQLPVWSLGAVLGACLAGGVAHADKGAPPIFPLAKVKKGQRGYGLTVFQGTKPERFEFEVLGVNRGMFPKQDIILVRSDDPKILEVGFARGMSGSPLYLEGKVACAFSYGFPFSKGNIGGCTPIEYMIAEGNRPVRGPEKTALATADEWVRYRPLETIASTAGTNRPVDSWLLSSPLPTADTRAPSATGMVPAAVPLAIAGLGGRVMEQARRVFEPFGIEPMQGGGGGGLGTTPRGPTAFEMGGPIGGILAEGDVSMTGTGTVSYVDGDRVLAFGHSFFQMGELYMPAATAEVHAVVPSYNMAFKMASPLRMLGSLVQDRQSTIVIDTRKETGLIPVDIRVRTPGREETFRSRVLRHKFLTPPLVGMMASNAAQILAPDVADVTVTVKSTLSLKGREPLTFTDYLYAPDGPGGAISAARALRVMVPLLFNPFAPVQLERIDVDVDVAFQADVASLESLRSPDAELPYGEKTYVEATLKPFAGAPYTVRIPIQIPERLAGSTLKIEVVPGDAARPDVAPPESLDDVIQALRKTFPANTLVATVYTPDEGVTLSGRVLPDLPASALDTVKPVSSTRKGETYRSVMRSVVPSRQVVQGKQELVVKVREPR